MATAPTKNSTSRARHLSAAWPAFAQKLATALEKLEEDQLLILSVKHGDRFVQFAAQGGQGMRIETTSNSYLAQSERLNERQISTLVEAGWHAPTGTPAESTPQHDPDGSPNFYVDFPAPVSVAAVANLAVRSLAEILYVPHPGFLQYEAFDADHKSIDLPELGLKLKDSAAKDTSQQDLRQQLLAALERATGISDLAFDNDGDIAVRSGSAVVLVRIVGDPPHVRIYSPILRDVAETEALFGRLNDINARESLMRFIFQNGVIYGISDVSAVPFVDVHVIQAFEHVCAIADGIDNLLQREFGGRMAYVEPMPSLMKH